MFRGHPSVLTFIFLLIPLLNIAQNTEGVTVTPSNGDFIYCFPDTIVEVKIDVPSNSNAISEFRLKWCADCDPIIIPGTNNPGNQTHRYALSELYERDCAYNSSCLDEGICFTVSILARFSDGSSDNNSFDLFFRFPPRPNFSFPNTACTGQEIDFANNTCPTGDSSMEFMFDYGDGSPLDNTGIHSYADTGTYHVTLMSTNFCESNSISRDIQILGTPEAAFNLNPENGGRDTVCVGDIITLDGSISKFVTNYRWDINTRNVVFEEDTNDRSAAPRVRFTEGGTYTVELRVDNSCREPSEIEATLVVIEAPTLQLEEQADACLDFDYTPSPFDQLATYMINGVEESNFPISLPPLDQPYIIEARLSNECGPQVRRDTFFVNRPVSVSIAEPVRDTTVCVGSDPLALVIEGIDENAGSWQIDNVDFTPPFIPTDAGVYNISFVTNGTGECQTMDAVTITVQGLSIQAEDLTICEGEDSIRLEASPPMGVWTSTDCPGCVTPEGVFNPAAMGTAMTVEVTYSIRSTIGCSASRSISVSLDQPLSAFTIPNSVCAGEAINPDVSNAIGANFSWLVDGQTSSGPPFNLGGGPHEITLIVGSGDCEDTSSQSINVIAPPPPAQINANQVEGCSPLLVELGIAGNPVNGVAYTWDFDRAENDTSQMGVPGLIEFVNNSDTVQTFLVRLSVGNSCAGTDDQISIEVKPSPKASIGTAFDEFCSGDTIVIVNTSKGLPDEYTWIRSDGTVSNEPVLEPQLFLTDSVTTESITLIARNECNVDTFVKMLTILPTDVEPFFNLNNRTVCVGDTLQITNFANTNRVTYEISDGNFYNTENPIHIFRESGDFEIIQRAYACGFDSIILNISVAPEIQAAFISPTRSCPNTEVAFTNLSTNAVRHEWRVNGVVVSSLTSPIFTFDSLGLYTVELTAESPDGCRAQFAENIEVVNPPTVGFGISDSVCVNTLLDLSVNPSSTDAYVWLVDGQVVGDGTNPQLSIGEAGIHTITQMVTSDIGCSSDSTVTIFVRQGPNANFGYRLDFDCSPANVLFQDSSMNATSWEWSFGDGATSTEQNPMHFYELGGTFNVNLRVGFQGFCFHEIQQTVTINDTPQPSWNLIDERCTQEDEVILNVENDLEHFIEVNGIDFDYFQSGRNRFELVDPGDYQVSVVSGEGCESSFVVNVPVHQNFIAEIVTRDTAIVIGEQLRIKTNINQTNTVISWFPQTGIVDQDTSVTEPIVQPLEDMTYVMRATFENCVILDTIDIQVLGEEQVYVPSVFYPNATTPQNQEFKVFLGPGIQFLSVEIYDRWGEMVYQAEAEVNGQESIGNWDGTFQGESLNSAVFVYKIAFEKIDGSVAFETGEITLLR